MLRKPLVFKPNTLYHGDCLDIIDGWDADCVDLIYLDPPFNSNANYNVLYGKDTAGKPRDEPAQFTAFKDTWFWSAESGRRLREIKRAAAHPAHRSIKGLAKVLPKTGMLAYLVYMADRIAVMRDALKPTGSIYLHCDPTASHYLKVIMDDIFGAQNFRNEISWRRRKDTHNLATKHMGRAHDIILYYGKSERAVYQKQFLPYDDGYIESHYKHEDDNGRYRILPCTNESGGNKPYEFEGVTRSWRFEPKRMRRMLQDNLLVQLSPGGPFYYKKYIQDAKGVPLQDMWLDIAPVRGNESLGYPTQKPVSLLERIISTSSNKGDLVLDPFCGCGTTAEAAYQLGRRFIGIDISPYAITRICSERLKHAEGVSVQGLPTDLDGARHMAEADRFLFEQWAVTTLPGFEPNEKQTGDGGIDGVGYLLNPPPGESGRCVVQVKSGAFTPSDLRALLSKITGGHAGIGIFVTMEKMGDTPTARACVDDAGQLLEGAKTFNRMMFWSMEEHFAGAKLQLPAMAHPRTGKAMQDAIPVD